MILDVAQDRAAAVPGAGDGRAARAARAPRTIRTVRALAAGSRGRAAIARRRRGLEPRRSQTTQQGVGVAAATAEGRPTAARLAVGHAIAAVACGRSPEAGRGIAFAAFTVRPTDAAITTFGRGQPPRARRGGGRTTCSPRGDGVPAHAGGGGCFAPIPRREHASRNSKAGAYVAAEPGVAAPTTQGPSRAALTAGGIGPTIGQPAGAARRGRIAAVAAKPLLNGDQVHALHETTEDGPLGGIPAVAAVGPGLRAVLSHGTLVRAGCTVGCGRAAITGLTQVKGGGALEKDAHTAPDDGLPSRIAAPATHSPGHGTAAHSAGVGDGVAALAAVTNAELRTADRHRTQGHHRHAAAPAASTGVHVAVAHSIPAILSIAGLQNCARQEDQMVAGADDAASTVAPPVPCGRRELVHAADDHSARRAGRGRAEHGCRRGPGRRLVDVHRSGGRSRRPAGVADRQLHLVAPWSVIGVATGDHVRRRAVAVVPGEGEGVVLGVPHVHLEERRLSNCRNQLHRCHDYGGGVRRGVGVLHRHLGLGRARRALVIRAGDGHRVRARGGESILRRVPARPRIPPERNRPAVWIHALGLEVEDRLALNERLLAGRSRQSTHRRQGRGRAQIRRQDELPLGGIRRVGQDQVPRGLEIGGLAVRAHQEGAMRGQGEVGGRGVVRGAAVVHAAGDDQIPCGGHLEGTARRENLALDAGVPANLECGRAGHLYGDAWRNGHAVVDMRARRESHVLIRCKVALTLDRLVRQRQKDCDGGDGRFRLLRQGRPQRAAGQQYQHENKHPAYTCVVEQTVEFREHSKPPWTVRSTCPALKKMEHR